MKTAVADEQEGDCSRRQGKTRQEPRVTTA